MRNHDTSSIRSRPVECILDNLLGFIVKRRCGLVKQKNGRIANQCPRNGDTLLLSSRQLRTTRATECIVPVVQVSDELVRIGLFSCFDNVRVSYIIVNGAVEYESFDSAS